LRLLRFGASGTLLNLALAVVEVLALLIELRLQV
jgi:hypothetical protein